MNTCYTTITNGYDELKPCPEAEGWEYIVFADRFLDVAPWRCIVTGKHNRDLKIKSHGEMHRNLTLYVDGSIEIIGDLNELIKEVSNRFAAWKHPHRDRLEEEARAVIKLKGCNPGLVWQQVEKYTKEGYKGDTLAACGVLLRDLSDSVVRDVNNTWYNEWVGSCGRDQISFLYSCWKHGIEPDLFSNEVFNRYFRWGNHL